MKRYWITGFDVTKEQNTLIGKERVKEHPNGNWVMFEDVQQLQQENEGLKDELKEWKRMRDDSESNFMDVLEKYNDLIEIMKTMYNESFADGTPQEMELGKKIREVLMLVIPKELTEMNRERELKQSE